MTLKAMIFAAGYGTRMSTLSDLLAKPALPFYGKPLIAHTLTWLARAGVTTTVVNLHHNAPTVVDAVNQHTPNGMEIIFSRENEILGTGGGLKAAAANFEKDAFFIAINGDVFTQINLKIPLRMHRAESPLATLVLTDNPDHRELFGVGIDVNKQITDFWGEPENTRALRHCAFTGIHIIDPRLLKSLPDSGYACIKEQAYLPALFAQQTLMSTVMGGHWFDLGTPQRYLDAHVKMLNNAGGLCGYPERSPGVFSADPLPPGLTVKQPVVVGPGLTAEKGSRMGPCAFLGANVELREKVHVQHAVVWDNTQLTTSISHAIAAPDGIVVSTKSD
ncbi:MAG TPA: NDP-sugar synthase [Myxococcales bacterium]|nr:NDP-sugar synthase [Myxococcales bacterium]HIN86823.1 NDP-sugar synthase [Myxococcales bacterium]